MSRKHLARVFILAFVGIMLLYSTVHGAASGYVFSPIEGFNEETNERLQQFLIDTAPYHGRKVAVFDGDGTVLGQCPHYLADECLYGEAQKHPEKKPDIIQKMKTLSNVSLPYVKDRVFFSEGDTVQYWRELGDFYFKKYYHNKIFTPMKTLIGLLVKNGFEVWIITASPEHMYQKFLSRELAIPITNVVGVKTVVSGGKISATIVEPVPQDHGKVEAIETFVQEQPLFVAGNSRGDKEMIEFSRGLKMIVNPDEHIAPDQTESIAHYARMHNWLIVRVQDVPEKGFPSISSKVYGIGKNKAREKSPEDKK